MQPIFAKVIAPLLDALPDAILLVDEAGLIVFANRAVRPLLGYEPAELIDQSVSILIPARSLELHERLMASFWLEPRSRPMTSRPFLHALSKAGEEVPVTISLAPVILSGERCCVAALRDATLMQREIATSPGEEGIRQ